LSGAVSLIGFKLKLISGLLHFLGPITWDVLYTLGSQQSTKDILMATERQRLLVLALETLENKKIQIEADIAELTRELRGVTAQLAKPARTNALSTAKPKRRHRTLSDDERQRRSRRMKAYWENWRKQRDKHK
jgi:hypothetical protein